MLTLLYHCCSYLVPNALLLQTLFTRRNLSRSKRARSNLCFAFTLLHLSPIQYVGVLERGETVFTNECWSRPQNDPSVDPKGCLSSATTVAVGMFPTKELEDQIVSALPLSIPHPQNRPLRLTMFCEILQERTLNIARVTFPARNVGLRRYFLHLIYIDTPC